MKGLFISWKQGSIKLYLKNGKIVEELVVTNNAVVIKFTDGTKILEY